MPHHLIEGASMTQKAIDADTLIYYLSNELMDRKEGKLPYSYGEAYLAVGIPKEFLN